MNTAQLDRIKRAAIALSDEKAGWAFDKGILRPELASAILVVDSVYEKTDATQIECVSATDARQILKALHDGHYPGLSYQHAATRGRKRLWKRV